LLRIQPNPRLTIEVTRRRLLANNPLVVLDLGARGGPHPVWQVFDPDVVVRGVEADPAAAAGVADTRPVVLGERRERRVFHRGAFGAADSLYRFEELFAGVGNADAFIGRVPSEVETVPLDDLEFGPVDVIKLDLEGAELEALRGGEQTLASCLMVETEVHFPRRPADAAVFADIDEHLRERGFELYDLDVHRFARSAFPSPSVYDYRDEQGRPMTGNTVEGQVLTGDALYFRPDRRRRLKLACLFETHRLPDCAAEQLLGTHDEALINFLTPPIGGRYPTYREYLGHARRFLDPQGRVIGPNYHLLEELWDRAEGSLPRL
jgi:FkbM family methyltransferase